MIATELAIYATQSAYFKAGLRLVYDVTLSAQKEKEKVEKTSKQQYNLQRSVIVWSTNYDSVIWKPVVNWEI